MTEHRHLDGTDGFRDIATREAGPGLMNAETFAGLTYALVARQIAVGEKGPVVVAQDTRESGNELRRAAIAGALAHDGVTVWDIGIAPTPMAQAAARHAGAMATVVATASHNPAEYNGWKGMLGERKPSKAEARSISDDYWGQVEDGLVIPKYSAERAVDMTWLTRWYVREVVDSIEMEFGFKPLENKTLVYDSAYGAAAKVAPQVLTRLGANLITYSGDGPRIINEGCGAANLDGLRSFMETSPNLFKNPNFLGAIANDGDADRMMGMGIAADEAGDRHLVTIDGNHVMGTLAQGEPGIVGTEYTNSGLVKYLKEMGIDFKYCDNGDSYVTQKLHELRAQGQTNWRRGGEFTGHHIDLDWLSSGDGVRMAAWFAAYTARRNKTFGDIYEQLPLWTEHMMKVELPDDIQVSIREDPEVQAALTQAEEELGENGRIILRPSGTERGVVRVWGEGVDNAQIGGMITKLADVVGLRKVYSSV